MIAIYNSGSTVADIEQVTASVHFFYGFANSVEIVIGH